MKRQQTFSTERLPLAIFLHATDRLHFLGCQPTGSGKVQFEFGAPEAHVAGDGANESRANPQQAGAQIEFEFDRGAAVAATALFASQKFLRRQMTDALNRRLGVSEHGHER